MAKYGYLRGLVATGKRYLAVLPIVGPKSHRISVVGLKTRGDGLKISGGGSRSPGGGLHMINDINRMSPLVMFTSCVVKNIRPYNVQTPSALYNCFTIIIKDYIEIILFWQNFLTRNFYQYNTFAIFILRKNLTANATHLRVITITDVSLIFIKNRFWSLHCLPNTQSGPGKIGNRPRDTSPTITSFANHPERPWDGLLHRPIDFRCIHDILMTVD